MSVVFFIPINTADPWAWRNNNMYSIGIRHVEDKAVFLAEARAGWNHAIDHMLKKWDGEHMIFAHNSRSQRILVYKDTTLLECPPDIVEACSSLQSSLGLSGPGIMEEITALKNKRPIKRKRRKAE